MTAVFCCSLVLSIFRRRGGQEKIRIGNVFDFDAVRLSTTSYLYSWIGLWTLNVLRFSVIYFVCTEFFSSHQKWGPCQDCLLSEHCGQMGTNIDCKKGNVLRWRNRGKSKRWINGGFAFGVRENMRHIKGTRGFSEQSEKRHVGCREEF